MQRLFLACAIVGAAASVKGEGPADVPRRDGLPPDFSCEGAGLVHRHRREGDADIYFVSNPALTNVSAECLFRVTGKVPEFWDAADGSAKPAPVFKDEGGQTRLPLRLGPAGSLWIAFRPGESKRHATRLVFTPVESREKTGLADGAYDVELEKRGPLLLAWQPGTFEITLADGRTVKKQVYEVPAPFAVDGPWRVRFQKGQGPAENVVLDRLGAWPRRAEAGLHDGFRGPVAYEKSVRVPDDLMGPGRRMMLDLGAVRDVAVVTLNGQELGGLRKAPFVADVTAQLKVGENALRIEVTGRRDDRLSGGEPPAAGLLGPVCIRTVFELPGR